MCTVTINCPPLYESRPFDHCIEHMFYCICYMWLDLVSSKRSLWVCFQCACTFRLIYAFEFWINWLFVSNAWYVNGFGDYADIVGPLSLIYIPYWYSTYSKISKYFVPDLYNCRWFVLITKATPRGREIKFITYISNSQFMIFHMKYARLCLLWLYVCISISEVILEDMGQINL